MLGNGVGLNMTNEIHRDNEDWLLALSGEPRQGADSFTNSQAEAIRAALKRRAAAIEQESPEPSETGYHRLLFRLKREGHIGPDADKKRLGDWAANDDFTFGSATGTGDAKPFGDFGQYDLPPGMRSAGASRSQRISTTEAKTRSWYSPAIGMAAVFVLGAALIFYMEIGSKKEEDPFALRGGEAVVLIVSNQSEKVAELVDALNPLGGEVKITREADGSTTLIVKATERVVERLAKDRIQPDVHAGYIRISVVPKK